jgi:outer membrane protein OmpA-like peptidoglycan-associated protein
VKKEKKHMLTRRTLAAALIAVIAMPAIASAQANTPSAAQIERQLDAAPRMKLRPNQRVTVREFKRRPDLRRAAPSIDIQSINFAFGSAEVPRSQYNKLENIANALNRILRRDRRARVLIEGHTDAVGSFESNQVLSERRAEELKRTLVREFDVPSRALEPVGYGEEFLLVQTQNENWRNRRVTLRRIDGFTQ